MIVLPQELRCLPSARAVEDRLFRAIGVLRWVLLINQLGMTWIRRDNFTQPVAGWSVVACLVIWSVVVTWAYISPRRRTAPWLIADLTVALAALASSPFVKGDGFEATIPGFWVMAPLLAWSARWSWIGGTVAGVLVVTVDLTSRQDIDQGNYGNAFLLAIGGLIVGYMAHSLQRAAVERDAAERAAAAAAERARLARAVHDGVLQVLALTQRRGTEPGGDPELGHLAGQQEESLRALIRQQDAITVRNPGGVRVDQAQQADVSVLVQELVQGTRLQVQVATPGGAVMLPIELATELVAAAAATLDNVSRHVGEAAEAWVLLEDLENRVILSVRDEGPGIPEGRLAQARDAGRLGITGSIEGRMVDIGGSADLTTGASGTEWELSVPRP